MLFEVMVNWSVAAFLQWPHWQSQKSLHLHTILPLKVHLSLTIKLLKTLCEMNYVFTQGNCLTGIDLPWRQTESLPSLQSLHWVQCIISWQPFNPCLQFARSSDLWATGGTDIAIRLSNSISFSYFAMIYNIRYIIFLFVDMWNPKSQNTRVVLWWISEQWTLIKWGKVPLKLFVYYAAVSSTQKFSDIN